MADGLTTEVLQEGFSRIAEKLDQAAGELNTLDGHLGDGDLGVAMQRAARSIREILPTLSQDLGMALLRCAQALVKVSGSSYGTLISTGLMSAAKATRGKTQVSWGQISNLLSGAIEAMAQRGKKPAGTEDSPRRNRSCPPSGQRARRSRIHCEGSRPGSSTGFGGI